MKGWFMAAFAAVSAVVAIFLYGKKSGANEEKLENNEEVLRSVKDSKNIQNHIDRLSHDELNKLLSDRD